MKMVSWNLMQYALRVYAKEIIFNFSFSFLHNLDNKILLWQKVKAFGIYFWFYLLYMTLIPSILSYDLKKVKLSLKIIYMYGLWETHLFFFFYSYCMFLTHSLASRIPLSSGENSILLHKIPGKHKHFSS